MSIREVDVESIKVTVTDLFLKANTVIRPDVLSSLRRMQEQEAVPEAKKMLQVLINNAVIAEEEKLPMCQDTGLSVVFMEIGQEVAFTGGYLIDAVNEGVETAYREGFFRKSVVNDPLLRDNTGTNTPALVHTEIVSGNEVKITVFPKGFGSENKGRIIMLNPTSGEEDIIDFCIETVQIAGSDACPPYMLGIGIGGTMDYCGLLAKKALLRPIDSEHPEKHIAALEKKIEEKVQDLDIGVMGLGGKSTVMGVNIETYATHIAGLPVAINISCHALRFAEAVL